MKTAVSIPDDVYRRPEELAKQTNRTRSRPTGIVAQGGSLDRSRIATVVCVAVNSFLKWAVAPGNVLLPVGLSGLPNDSVANVSQIVTLDRSVFSEHGTYRAAVAATDEYDSYQL
jgi:mRNA-degrading endonuclease toxin of MazEF toxin-antitoxin module